MVSALCPFPFRATLKFGAVSGNPSREGYTISGSDAVTTSQDCQFKLTKSVRDVLTGLATKYILLQIGLIQTYKILHILRFENITPYLIKELLLI
ncbi:MAG: hypothetical protein ACYDIA_18235 [Candidatus Humimicrobiaceae bacterium]